MERLNSELAVAAEGLRRIRQMRIFLLGATPSIQALPNDTVIDKLAKTGGNTGNQVIAYGLLQQLVFQGVTWDYSIPPEQVNEQCDVFLIAAANFLFPGFDFAGMANYIERTRLPCVMVGLGAQSNSYDTDIPLKPGTDRLIKVVAERSKLIGVRGPFTEAVLARKGIHNVQVTGCPSYYATRSPTLSVKKPPLPRDARVSINASRDVIKHSFDPHSMSSLLRDLVREGVARDADFVAQSETEEMFIASTQDSEERRRHVECLANMFAGVAPEAALRSWIEKHMKVYFDVDEWLGKMKNYDFVYGTRFHGCILALLAGVPALIICHDTRTADMCEFLGIPSINLKDLKHINTEQLYAAADVDRLQRRYAELFAPYRKFLEVNGLEHRLSQEMAA